MSTVSSATSGSAAIDDLMNNMNPKAKEADAVSKEADKFMTLLVTQMKNQDPLNPMDNAQVTSQLAQLSTVTGVNKLNETLEQLKGSYQATETLAATSLVGRGVLVEGNHLNLLTGKAVLGVELASPADDVKVIISSQTTGKDVATIELGSNEAGSIPLAWDGIPDPTKLDKDGKPVRLADGTYNIRVVATRGTETLTDAKALSYDTVASVTTNSKDGVKLNLPGKGVLALADIKQVL